MCRRPDSTRCVTSTRLPALRRLPGRKRPEHDLLLRGLSGRRRARGTPRGAALLRLGQPACRLVRRPEGGGYPWHDDRTLRCGVPLDTGPAVRRRATPPLSFSTIANRQRPDRALLECLRGQSPVMQPSEETASTPTCGSRVHRSDTGMRVGRAEDRTTPGPAG